MNSLSICKTIIQSIENLLHSNEFLDSHRQKNRFVRSSGKLTMYHIIVYLFYTSKQAMNLNISNIRMELPALDFPKVSKQAVSKARQGIIPSLFHTLVTGTNVTCGYDLKKIESVNFDTGEVVIGEESFNEYKDEINDYLSRRGIDNQFSVSITREGTQEIRGSSGPCDRWVNEDGSWEMGHDLTPDDKEGYVFVPADIQIVRAEGTLHIIQK